VELTLPGFIHDVCSAISPLGLAVYNVSAMALPRAYLSLVRFIAPSATMPHGSLAIISPLA
jgi:hypothetical protein